MRRFIWFFKICELFVYNHTFDEENRLILLHIAIHLKLHLIIKVQNTLTGNKATTRCPMCHHLQSDFNKNKDFKTVEGALATGLCLMHFGVRAMEFFLKIGYNSGNLILLLPPPYHNLQISKFITVLSKLIHKSMSV